MIECDLSSPIQLGVNEESSKALSIDFNQNDVSYPLQLDVPSSSLESSTDRSSPPITDPSSPPQITKKRENIFDNSELETASKRVASCDFEWSDDESPSEQFSQNNPPDPEIINPPKSPITNVEANSRTQPQRVQYRDMKEDIQFWSSYLGKINKKKSEFGIFSKFKTC